jgi:hypothetical protein
MATCLTPTLQISNIDRADGNDLTAQFTMRYRLASDPDTDPSYAAVTTTKTLLGVTFPYFDFTTVDAGTYVVHTYQTTSGSTTGTKVTVVVGCDDPS